MRSAALVAALVLSFVPFTHSQISADGQACIDCHSGSTSGIVEQWAGERPRQEERGLLLVPSRQ